MFCIINGYDAWFRQQPNQWINPLGHFSLRDAVAQQFERDASWTDQQIGGIPYRVKIKLGEWGGKGDDAEDQRTDTFDFGFVGKVVLLSQWVHEDHRGKSITQGRQKVAIIDSRQKVKHYCINPENVRRITPQSQLPGKTDKGSRVKDKIVE